MIDSKKYDLLLSPVITEKYTLVNQYGQYIFKVHNSTTKKSLTDAIEFIFNVKVKNIRILNMKAKKKRFKGRIGTISGFKKAFVSLDGTDIIDFTKYGTK